MFLRQLHCFLILKMNSFQFIYPKLILEKFVEWVFLTTSRFFAKPEQACPYMAWESAEKKPCAFSGVDVAILQTIY